MAINFNTIDTTSRVPRIAMEFDTTSGRAGLPVNAKNVLIVGQRKSGSTFPLNVPTQLFRATDSENGGDNAGSILDHMAKAAFLAYPDATLFAVAMDDPPGGTAAALVATIAGTATAAGGFQLSFMNHDVNFAVAIGDTPTVQGASLLAAIAADPTLPFSAANAAGVVTLTLKNKGLVGNGVTGFVTPIGVTGSTCTLANSGAFTAGAGTSDPTAALASASAGRYFDIAIGLDDSTSGGTANTYVNNQGAAEIGLGEVSIQGMNTTLSALTTASNALNGPRSVIGGIRNSPSWSVEIAAALAAVMSSEPVANRPYNTLPLPGIIPPLAASRWNKTEEKALLANGVSPLVVLPTDDGEQVCILRIESTRTKNAASNLDYSQSDIGVIQTFDYMRDAYTLMFQTNYGRNRLSDDDPDGLLPVDVATPSKVKQDLIGTARKLEDLGMVQDVDDLLDQFDVEKNNGGEGVSFVVPANIVKGLQQIYGKIVLIQS